MTKTALLKIDFQGLWHAGSGASGGQDVDSGVIKVNGLPIVPAKHYKGLLRQAGLRLAQSQSIEAWNPQILNLLFGHSGEKSKDDSTETAPTKDGILSFRDACLSPWLQDEVNKRPELASTIFTRIETTAIDHETRVAKTNSLRSMEAVIPLLLYAEIRWNPDDRNSTAEELETIAALENSWWELMDCAAALVTSLGGKRNDGLGRAILTVEAH